MQPLVWLGLGLWVITQGSLTYANQDQACEQVSGVLFTNFISENETLGVVLGSLEGGIRAVVVEQVPQDDGRVFLRLRHTYVTRDGATLHTEDEGIGTPIREGLMHVTERSVVVGGTGRFDNVRGTLEVHGSLDMERGETVFRYHGELCRTEPATHE